MLPSRKMNAYRGTGQGMSQGSVGVARPAQYYISPSSVLPNSEYHGRQCPLHGRNTRQRTMASPNPLPKTPITRDELTRTNIAMLVLTTLFVLSRAGVQVSKRKTFELQDIFIYLAYALYVALW